MKRLLAVILIVGLAAGVALAAASYPSSVKLFTAKSAGDIIQAAHVNDLQDEVMAVEAGLLNGFQHSLRPFTDAAYDLGISASIRWRDLFLSRNALVGGGLAVGGSTVESTVGRITVRNDQNAITDGLLVRNMSTGAAAQVDIIWDRLNAAGTTTLRWHAAVDIGDTPYWRVESINPGVGVIATPLSLGFATGQINFGGNLAFGANGTLDNNYDIGISGGRPRDLNVGRTLNLAQGTITANSQAILHTATWNAGGVTFTGIVSSITDTASAVASSIMDLQVAGVSRFKITKAGYFVLDDSTPPAQTATQTNTQNFIAASVVARPLSDPTPANAAWNAFTAEILGASGLSKFIVAGYFGAKAPSGSAQNIWGLNPLVQPDAGSTGDAIGSEVDVNNNQAAGKMQGVVITGNSSFNPFRALSIQLAAGRWQQGMQIANSLIPLVIVPDAAATNGLYFNGGVSAPSGAWIKVRPLDDNSPTNTVFSIVNAADSLINWFVSKNGSMVFGTGATLTLAADPAAALQAATKQYVDNRILSGTTGSIGGGALLAGACTSGTVTVTGATTSMVPVTSPNTYPGDGIVWDAQVTSANTVTVKVCAILALTPTASTYNVRVIP